MNNFDDMTAGQPVRSISDTVIRQAVVKVKRDGRKLKIAIDGEGISRITFEIDNGELIVIDDEPAALPRSHPGQAARTQPPERPSAPPPPPPSPRGRKAA